MNLKYLLSLVKAQTFLIFLLIFQPSISYKLFTTISTNTNQIDFMNSIQGNTFAYANSDKSINICNETKKLFTCKKLENKHSKRVRSMFNMADGNLVSISDDKTIGIWNKNESFKFKNKIEANDDEISAGYESAPGLITYTSGLDFSFNTYGYFPSKTLHEHSDGVYKLLKLDNGLIASDSDDGTIKIFNPNKEFSLVATINGHGLIYTRLIKLKNGMLVGGYRDGTIRVWNPYTLSQVKTLIGHTSYITSLLQLKNGMLASASKDKTIHIWDPYSNFSLVNVLIGHTQGIFSLFELENEMLVSGGLDGIIKIWNIKNYYYTAKTLSINKIPITFLQIRNGHLLSLTAGKGESNNTQGIILIWDPNTDFSLVNEIKTQSSISHYASLIQLQNGLVVSGSSGENTIKVWDPSKNYSLTATFDGYYVIELKNGKLVSASLSDKKIKVWDPLNNFSLISTYNSDLVTYLLDLDDGIFLSASVDSTIKVWDMKLSLRKSLSHLNNKITKILNLSTNKIATLVKGGVVNLFSSDSHDGQFTKLEKEFKHDAEITDMLIIDNYLYTATLNRYLNVWDINTGVKTKSKRESAVINCLLAVDNLIVSGFDDGSIRIYNQITLELVQTFWSHPQSVNSLIKLENSSFASSGDNSLINIYVP